MVWSRCIVQKYSRLDTHWKSRLFWELNAVSNLLQVGANSLPYSARCRCLDTGKMVYRSSCSTRFWELLPKSPWNVLLHSFSRHWKNPLWILMARNICPMKTMWLINKSPNPFPRLSYWVNLHVRKFTRELRYFSRYSRKFSSDIAISCACYSINQQEDCRRANSRNIHKCLFLHS